MKTSLLQALPQSSMLDTAIGLKEHQCSEIKMCLRKCVPKNLWLNQSSFIHIVALICTIIISPMTYFQCGFVFLRLMMPASDFVSNVPNSFVHFVNYKNISTMLTSHTSTTFNHLTQLTLSHLKVPYLLPTLTLIQFLSSKSHTKQEK